MLDNKVVVKAVRGTPKAPLPTKMVTEDLLSSDKSMSLCPAMYQEYVPGVRHVRAQCFGDDVHAVLLKSQDLDWRINLNIPSSVYELD